MIIQEGDMLVSKLDSYNYDDSKVLTKNRIYSVILVRNNIKDKDICILDDLGMNWYFGQIGYLEPWTNFFYTLKEFNRIKKIENILNNQ
jgi:hypothetical protein